MKNLKIKKIIRKTKIIIKDFIIDELWVYLVVIGSIALCSWMFNKWIEGIMFCVAHIFIRKAFDKQFHFNKTAYCLSLTLAIIWFSIPITLPLTVSLLGSIPIAFLICFFGFVAQDRDDYREDVKELNDHVNKLLMQLEEKPQHKDINSMDKDELYSYCRECGLDDVDCKIAYYVIIERLKGKELYETIGYSESQAKRKRKKILKQLNNER